MSPWQDFVQVAFYSLVGFIGIFVVRFLQKLNDNIQTLNERVAVIIERTDNHEHRISNLEENQ